MTRTDKIALSLGASAVSLGLVALAAPASAAYTTPARATAYVRADTGLVTFNPGVNPNSGCATPDYDDVRTPSNWGATDNDVHVPACLFRSAASPARAGWSATTSDRDGCTGERVLRQVAIGWAPAGG